MSTLNATLRRMVTQPRPPCTWLLNSVTNPGGIVNLLGPRQSLDNRRCIWARFPPIQPLGQLLRARDVGPTLEPILGINLGRDALVPQ